MSKFQPNRSKIGDFRGKSHFGPISQKQCNFWINRPILIIFVLEFIILKIDRGLWKKVFPWNHSLYDFHKVNISYKNGLKQVRKNAILKVKIKMSVFTYIFKICNFQAPIMVWCLSNSTLCLQHVHIEKKIWFDQFSKFFSRNILIYT